MSLEEQMKTISLNKITIFQEFLHKKLMNIAKKNQYHSNVREI